MYWINRVYIQNKSVSIADRSVCPNCQVWLLGESWYLLYVPRTGQVWYKAFFRWVWVQGHSPDTSSSSKNASGPCQYFPEKWCLKHQPINLAPSKRVRTCGHSPLRLEDACQVAPQPTATGTRTHSTRSVYWPTQPECSSPVPPRE